MAAASSSADGNNPPGAGALEPGASLSAIREVIQSQVPQSAERDRVLDVGRHLASGLNQKGVRSLAGKWEVRQKVGRANRGTSDILNEVQENMRRAGMRLLQKEVREEGAGAVAREACATEVSVSQSGSEVVVLTESTTGARSGRSSSEKLADQKESLLLTSHATRPHP